MPAASAGADGLATLTVAAQDDRAALTNQAIDEVGFSLTKPDLVTERVSDLPVVRRGDMPPIDRVLSTGAPALPCGSDRTRMDTGCENGIRWVG